MSAVGRLRGDRSHRLLDVISKTFDALRKGSDLLRVTACSDSFKVLAGIIEDAIANIMSQATLDRPYSKVERLC